MQVESLEEFDRRVDRRRHAVAGVAGAARRPHRARRGAGRAAGRRGDLPRLHVRARRRGAAERGGALVLPALTIAPVDVYRSQLYTAPELYDATPYQRLPGRPGLRVVPDARRRRRRAGPLAARPRDRRGTDGLDRAQAPGRRDGRARVLRAATAEYADAARLGHGARRPPRGRHRRRPRRDGGRQPRLLPGDLARVPGPRRRRRPRRSPGLPTLGRRLAPARPRGALRGRRAARLARHPDLALRPRAVQRLRRPASPSTSATPPARRSCSRSATPASSSSPAPAAPSRRSSRTRCENYYADESSVAEMVLVGRTYWTETLPAWPLLRSLARGRPMESRVHLVDDVDEAVDLLGQAASSR